MNIAEILKYCPKGTKLYSTVFGEVTLDEVDIHDIYPIVVRRFNYLRTSFDKEGHYLEDYPGAECVLFPSKEQKDWNEFRLPVKAGDIMMSKDGGRPFIFKKYKSHCRGKGECFSDFYCGINKFGKLEIKPETTNDPYWTMDFTIPASEEAKKELFDKMEEAGYKWNANTLKLEKVVPKFKNKFKPFDKVLVRNDIDEEWTINLFSHYDEKDKAFPFICINDFYRYCIPYEGNEYLVGKTVNIKKI